VHIVWAALLYFCAVFGAGFLLGPIRVFWLEPRLGPVVATACEAPLLLVAMIVAARWIPRAFGFARDQKALVAIGIGALALSIIADFTVGLWLRGVSPTQQLAQLVTGQGLVYLGLLVSFMVMPGLANSFGHRGH
jgi:hypothetical protein